MKKKQLLFVSLFGAAMSLAAVTDGDAGPLVATASAVQSQETLVEEVAVVVRRRPGVAVVRPGVAWRRPGHFWWRPGGAVAAGAALGFVAAATAASWAGAAPGPNMCWYYTDPSRRQGFWDHCP